jgi:hypothetical protein
MIYTLNKLVTINSKYGDQENGTMKSKMLFNYRNILADDETILKSFVTILNAQMPCSFYVINSTNNKLVISGPAITTKTIIISNGNYNANTLITELTTKITASGLNMEITINKSNGILTFTSTGFVNYYFGSTSTILDVLGTDSSKIASSNIYTCSYPLNLLGVKKLLIRSERLAIQAVSSIDYASTNVLVTIPVDVPPFSMISYTSQSESNKNLLNIRSINQIDIQIYDENDNLIDFNNLDWAISLVISSEIQIVQQRIYMKDILKNNIEFPKTSIPSEELPQEQVQEEIPQTQNQKEFEILNYKNNI